MPEPQCDSCRYWRYGDRYERGVGNCHRYPPALVTANEYRAPWPRTDKDGFCGEYEAKYA